MKTEIGVFGTSHLAQTLALAAELNGMIVWRNETPIKLQTCPVGLLIAAEDVVSHDDLSRAKTSFDLMMTHDKPCYVLASQVPPGTTSIWGTGKRDRVFYQVDTLIMKNALERACAPEQIIIGCAAPDEPLPLAYQEYLMAFDCPILQMDYESAEFAKCAINAVLAAQIEAANELSQAAVAAGASWEAVREVLHGDKRIGEHAYLRPGNTNKHLDRDVDTINKLCTDFKVRFLHGTANRLT